MQDDYLAFQPDSTLSYKAQDLETQLAARDPLSMVCASPFGCEREYLTIPVTAFSNSTVTVSGKDYGLDLSQNVSVTNPFGFAFVSASKVKPATTYCDCKDNKSLRHHDILVSLDSDTRQYFPADLQTSTVTGVKSMTVMRICSVNADKEMAGGATFQSYNFNDKGGGNYSVGTFANKVRNM